jgi:hypothetical protein
MKGFQIVAMFSHDHRGAGTEQATVEFLKENHLNLPVLYVPDNSVSRRYGIRAFPSAFLIDGQGVVQWAGDPRGAAIREELEKRLGVAKPQEPDSEQS